MGVEGEGAKTPKKQQIMLEAWKTMTMTALQRFEERDLTALNEHWKAYLEDNDYAVNTVKKYPQVVTHFLDWYEQQQHIPLTLHTLTPITLVSYRNALQKNKATSTVNVHVNALRTWCAWLLDQGYLPTNPAARFKLVDHQAVWRRDGLTPQQVGYPPASRPTLTRKRAQLCHRAAPPANWLAFE